MIENYSGDIFEAPVQIIIQNCNCFNRMKSGFAKAITDKYPRVAAVDALTKSGDKKKLGQFTVSLAAEDQPFYFINLYGQFNYGYDGKCYVLYDKFHEGLENIKSWIIKMGMENLTVGIPDGIGAGLAGGDWKKILSIISYVFQQEETIKVLICKK